MKTTNVFVVALLLLGSNLLAAEFVEFEDDNGKKPLKLKISLAAGGKIQYTDEKGITLEYPISFFNKESQTRIRNAVNRINDNPYKEFYLHKRLRGGYVSVAYSPDGKRIVGASRKTVTVWDADSGKELWDSFERGHTDDVYTVAFSPDGKKIASGGRKTLRIWDANTGKELQTLNEPVYNVAFSPDSLQLASSSSNGSLTVWDARVELTDVSGKYTINVIINKVADGKVQVSDGKGKTSEYSLRIFDQKSRALILTTIATKRENPYKDFRLFKTLKGHTGWVNSVAFSPDGKQIVSGGADKTLIIWDANTGKELQKLRGHTGPVKSVAFSPDGKQVVSGSDDRTLIIWDASSGRELQKLRGHTNSAYSVAFSPDGKKIASGGSTTLRIWDANSGKELQTIQARVKSVAFRPDGKRIVSGWAPLAGPSGDWLGIWDTVDTYKTLEFKGVENR